MNAATSRVWSEIFSHLNIVDDIDGENILDDGRLPSVETVEKWAHMYACRAIFKSSKAKGTAERWALAFIDDANWTEIAQRLIEEATE